MDLILKVFEHFGNFIFSILNKTTGGTWKIRVLITKLVHRIETTIKCFVPPKIVTKIMMVLGVSKNPEDFNKYVIYNIQLILNKCRANDVNITRVRLSSS